MQSSRPTKRFFHFPFHWWKIPWNGGLLFPFSTLPLRGVENGQPPGEDHHGDLLMGARPGNLAW